MKSDKELYRQLRGLPPEKLWKDEVPRFNAASPRERMERVAVIRAVGVVFAGTGDSKQRADVRAWLHGLLKDPSEKIRRYATAALPKIGAGTREEGEMLALLQKAQGERERKSLGRALGKIGGKATLGAVAGSGILQPQVEQKVRAAVARHETPSTVRLQAILAKFHRLRIHLRCRKGLEEIVRDEVEEYIAKGAKFRLFEVGSRFVAITPLAPFTLADIYALRCFGTVNFVLGAVRDAGQGKSADAIAELITSPFARYLLTTLTEGSVRYRLEFVAKGHQRGTVDQVVSRAFTLCPEILNDARSAPWSVDVHPVKVGMSVELRPRISPDPRMYYRRDDVDAASHPPLAACMARLAGRVKDEVVWDPFCGSGLELIESALLGGVKAIYGTDTSPEALAIARANVAAAGLKGVRAAFACCDFRDHAKLPGLEPGGVTLMITNPPMGRRIRIPDLRGLFGDLFDVAAKVLKPGGRLVFANPLRTGPRDPSLKLQYRETVDLGGFDCRLEVYLKQGG